MRREKGSDTQQRSPAGLEQETLGDMAYVLIVLIYCFSLTCFNLGKI